MDQITWPEELPFQVALDYHSTDEICARFHLSRDEYESIRTHKSFKDQVAAYKIKITEEGVGAKLIAQIHANDAVGVMMKIAKDTSVPGSVRMDALKTILNIGGVDTENADQSGSAFAGAGMYFQVLPPDVMQPRVEPEPRDVDQLGEPAADIGWLEIEAPDTIEIGDDHS